MLKSKEHYDLMLQFEQEHPHLRRDREDKANWPRGIIYQSGETNALFLAYRRGYAFGRVMERALTS